MNVIRLLLYPDFNSRTHVECDGVCRSKIDKLNISTHALTWSATGAMEDGELKTVDFNSRTHVECDIRLNVVSVIVCISTHALTWSA